jgi:hypothetical protein
MLEDSRRLIDYEERDDSANNSSVVLPAKNDRMRRYFNRAKKVEVGDVIGLMKYG